MKILEYFREIDIFGTVIHWKLLKKNKFKSLFGGLTTIFIFSLFFYKIIAFIYKVLDNGFAKQRNYYEKMGDNETIDVYNMTYIFTFDSLSSISKYLYNNSTKATNLSSYIDIDIIPLHSIVNKKNESCNLYKEHNIIYNKTSIEINFKKNIIKKSCKIVVKKDEFQIIDTFIVFNILRKQSFYDILKNQQLSMEFEYYFSFISQRFQEKIFDLEDVQSKFILPFSSSNSLNVKYTIRKISIEKKFNYDFGDYFIDSFDGFELDVNSFQYTIDKANFELDFIIIKLDTYAQRYEIVILSIDDVISVMGGFIQIILFVAQISVASYNDYNANKSLNQFFYDNLIDHDKKLDDFKIDYNNQIKSIGLNNSPNDKINGFSSHENKIINNKKLSHADYSKNVFSNPKMSLIKNFKEKKRFESNLDNLFISNVKHKFKDNCFQNIDYLFPKFNSKKDSEKKLSDQNSNIQLIDLSSMKKEKNDPDKESIINSNRSLNAEKSKLKKTEGNDNDLKMKKEKPSFLKNIKGRNFLGKKILNFNKKRKKFFEFDFFDYVSIEIFLKLLSGFESFKFFFFDKINKINFEKIADLFLSSQNCDILEHKVEEIDEKMLKRIRNDNLQKEIFKRFEILLEGK